MINQMMIVANKNMMDININKVVKDNKSKKITKKIQKRDNGLKILSNYEEAFRN